MRSPSPRAAPRRPAACAFGTTARRVPGGYLVSGKKIFASLSGHADYYGVLCTEVKAGEAEPSRRDTLYLAVPRDAPGVTVEGDVGPARDARHRLPQPASSATSSSRTTRR